MQSTQLEVDAARQLTETKKKCWSPGPGIRRNENFKLKNRIGRQR